MSIKNVIKSLSDERWNIGFLKNDIQGVLSGEPIEVDWVKHHCRNSWFADPFIFDVTDSQIVVLVEEWYKPIKRGRISKLTIDRETMTLVDKKVILQLETHLSFPAIKRNGHDIYIYPENSESGSLSLYQYDDQRQTCTKINIICDESVADAISTDRFGGRKLFATKQPSPNGNTLYIYNWDAQQQKYVESDKIVFEENIARMAGDFFEYEGITYRPTQECNVQYGHAVTIQQVNFNNDKFGFTEIRRMHSVHPQLNVGMHTFNMYKGVIVTDALGFDRPWIRTFLSHVGLLHK